VGARRDAQGGWLGFDEPDQLREAVEANLRTLEVARMDLVNLRILGEDHAGPGEPRPEQLAALEDLRREGKVDLIGVSNMSLDGLRKSVELVEVAEVQNEFSVLNRADEPTLDFCRERGIPYVPFFPLGSAFTGGPRKLASDPAISEIATKYGATPAQIALSWLLHHYDRMLLIPGTASVEHLEENLAAADVELDSDDMERLAAVAQSRP
jgi:pyridoxine 4-dehydrogenase